MNKITMFEGQEVKVKTDKGITLINLVHVAKCCGLTNKDRNGNFSVKFTRVKERLQKILQTELSANIKQEINYILDEIENTDDRNTIYMSTWLSKRLALECHSDRAMRFKNFLVTLDEARENGALISAEQLAPHVYQLAQGTQILGQVMQGMQVTMTQMQEYVKDSIQVKDHQIEKTMDLIGFRSINTKRLSDKLKEELREYLGVTIKASSPAYQKVKNKIFKEFKVIKWEDIPVNKYNAVYAFIEEVATKG